MDLALARWFSLSVRHPAKIIGLALIAAGLALWYTLGHLKVNTYPGNMLSDSLPWRQDKIQFEKAFPQFRDSVVVVLDAPTRDQALDAAKRLHQMLLAHAEHYEWVFYPGDSAYFLRQGLLYKDLPALDQLASRLAEVQPFLADVSRDQSLSGVFHLLGRALREPEQADLRLDTLFAHLDQAITGYLSGQSVPLSWISLVEGTPTAAADRRVLMEVMPKMEYSSLAPGADMIQGIRDAGASLGFSAQGVTLRLTGGAPLSIDELQSASVGAQMASVGSFVGVALVLLIGLRSFWLVVVVQVGLLLGLIFTAFFATLSLGQLNLISVAFSVMYIGLGADYAIYLCLRYRELSRLMPSNRAALKTAVRHVGGSLEIGTLTTSIGFFCFIPTSYRGVAELGIISGAGMFISLVVTLMILPAFLGLRRPARYRPAKASDHPVLPAWVGNGLSLPVRYAPWVLGAALVLGLICLNRLEFARFDSNPLNLQDPTRESVTTFRELLKDAGTSPWSLSVIAADAATAADLKARLSGLPEVDKVLSLEDFVPEDQEEKLVIIDQLALLLGGDLVPPGGGLKRVSAADAVSSLRTFESSLSRYLETQPSRLDHRAGTQLEIQMARLIDRLEGLDGESQEKAVARLESVLTGQLDPLLARLNEALKAQGVTAEALPEDLKSRWLNPEGLYRIEIHPKEDLHDPDAMQRFVASVKTVAPHATGTPVLFMESSRAVVNAFLEAFGLAFIAITLVLYLTMEEAVDVVLVLLPLVLASLLTAAIMAFAGVPFNFANIIALPLVFGMGVDNCIHMVHRYRTAPPETGSLLGTSTALAVFMSALTNISGFGNLAVSPHRGMASMGIMLSIGILSTLVSSMVVLPALLRVLERRKQARAVG